MLLLFERIIHAEVFVAVETNKNLSQSYGVTKQNHFCKTTYIGNHVGLSSRPWITALQVNNRYPERHLPILFLCE